MDFGLVNAFNNAVNRYGLSAALVGVSLLVVLYLAMKFVLARIESSRAAEAIEHEVHKQSLQQAADRERSMLQAINDARAQNMKIMENHLAHDKEEREAVVRALTEHTAVIREIATEMREDRIAASEHRKAIHERLNDIHLDVRENKS